MEFESGLVCVRKFPVTLGSVGVLISPPPITTGYILKALTAEKVPIE